MPVLGALPAVAGPQTQDVALAVHGDPDRHVDGAVGDLALADLHVDAVDEQHRVHRIEGTVLPLHHRLDHLIGDPRDRLLGHLGLIDLRQVGADLAVGQPLGRQRQHHLIHPAQPPAPLGHHHRLERSRPVPRHLDLDRADLGEHRLGPGSVAGVPRMVPGRVVGCVADMVGHLALEHRLQHLLGQIGEQPDRTDQAHPVGLGPCHQLVGQILGRDFPGQRSTRGSRHHRRRRLINRVGQLSVLSTGLTRLP
jgi:hypothetical protein